MRLYKSFFIINLILLLVFFSGCSKRTVTRVSPDTQIDLSGRWNDVDSRNVAEKVTAQIFSSARFKEYSDNLDRRPVIIVGWIQNKTTEHIDADNYVKKFEIVLFNSGIVDIVESGEFREKLREERADQQEFASPETTARWGRETGADLMLFGTMTSETDSYQNTKVVNYITTLYLTDLETNKRIWYGQEEIKKVIEN
jgi:uncharacterized protein (TIGR02722 family)